MIELLPGIVGAVAFVVLSVVLTKILERRDRR